MSALLSSHRALEMQKIYTALFQVITFVIHRGSVFQVNCFCEVVKVIPQYCIAHTYCA